MKKQNTNNLRLLPTSPTIKYWGSITTYAALIQIRTWHSHWQVSIDNTLKMEVIECNHMCRCLHTDKCWTQDTTSIWSLGATYYLSNYKIKLVDTWKVAPMTVADFSPTPIALKRAWKGFSFIHNSCTTLSFVLLNIQCWVEQKKNMWNNVLPG